MKSVEEEKQEWLEGRRKQIESAILSVLGTKGDLQTLRVQLLGTNQVSVTAQVQLDLADMPQQLVEQKG